MAEIKINARPLEYASVKADVSYGECRLIITSVHNKLRVELTRQEQQKLFEVLSSLKNIQQPNANIRTGTADTQRRA